MNKWTIIGGILLISLACGGIRQCMDYQDEKKRKEIQAYMDEGDYEKAEELMKESGVKMPLFHQAHMEALIAEGELRLAKNTATDNLDEGYYAEVVLDHLYDIYEQGGEEQVITALSSFTYPVEMEEGKWKGHHKYLWTSNDLNNLYSRHNTAIEQFLARMEAKGKPLSQKFKRLIALQLQPLYEEVDKDYKRTDYTEANSIKEKFGL